MKETVLVIEKIFRLLLYLVLIFFWSKLAYDLQFAFGPESARYWFPLRAVIAETAMALFLVCINIYVVVRLERQTGQFRITTLKKLLIVSAFLAGLLSCTDSENLMKFLDIYVFIPAAILLVIAWPAKTECLAIRYILMLLAAVLLLPNDTCENPPNWWWINNVGSSPLTYALPINVQLYMTMRSTNKFVVTATLVIVVLYHAGSIFHQWIGRY